MSHIKRLPDSEFMVLRAIWGLEAPITSAKIMEVLDHDKDWKPQTLLTILARLTEKGFLESVRVGRERHYTAIISEEEYLAVETGDFMSRFQGKNLGSLFKSFFDSNQLTEADLADIRNLLN